MCGITAILGKYDLNIIIDSLKNLQNRGYDSAGISYINQSIISSNFIIKKELNKESIDNLQKSITSIKLLNNYNNINNCIAHTRWATHGGITHDNCHPHISNNKKFCLVHNGIIENYDILKRFLLEKNYSFYSETDSEVIVNLIEYYYNISSEKKIQDAIFNAINMCKGTWGLVIQYMLEPNVQYAIKTGSPLLLGKTENFSIITSEVSGFNNLINNYHQLESNKLYKIDNINNIILDSGNYIKNIEYDLNNNNKIEYSLDNFNHYMIKEINEQSNIIKLITHNGARIKDDNIIFGGLDEYKEDILKCDNIILLGCGTSYHSCLYSIYYFNKFCKFKNIIAIDACNFNEYMLPSGNNCYVFVSQSGETKDLYSALSIIKKNKLLNGIMLGVINIPDSLIARSVNCGVYLNVGKEVSVASTKAFLGQSLILVMISLYLSCNKILNKKYFKDLRNLETLITKELEKEIHIDNFQNGYILANSNLLPIAMEAALKFKEITYSHIEALSVNSLKHGPLALVSDDNFINIILGEHKSAKQEILARNGKVVNIIIDNENIFNDLLYIIHLQRYNYELSIKKGINPDFPRNLAKVVTV